MKTLRALWKKDPGLFVSGGAHVLALVMLLLNFSRVPHLEAPAESIPVEMITTSEMNQVMNGEETAKQLPKPQRRVDKVAELEERHPAPPLAEAKKDTPPPPSPEKANDDPGPDVKPPQPVAAVPPPPMPPVPTPPERPVQPATPPSPPERPIQKAEAPPEPDKPPPPDAEVIAPKPPPRPKAEPKKEAKKVVKHETKVAKVVPPPPQERPEPPKVEPKVDPKSEPKTQPLDMVARLLDRLKPPTPVTKQRAGNEAKDQPHNDFSFDKITALLDHEAPQHKASTGRQLTQLASLGSPTSHAERMSPSMMAQLDGWLIDHYRGCWSYFGLGATQDYVPEVRVKMAQDGSLMAKPALLNPPSDPNLRSLADSAIRAVNHCDPMPIPDRYKAYYNAWRERVVRFDPKEMG